MIRNFSLLILCLFSIASYGLTLAVEDSWPPYATKEGEGYSRMIVKEAFEQVGLSPKIKMAPYARVLNDTKNGLVNGCFNVTRQKSTEKEYHFGKLPILKARAYFYTKNGDNKINSIKDLPNGFKIGLIIDYEYGNDYELNRSRFQEVRVKSQEQIINMLRLGRIDGAIMFEEVAKYTMKKMKVAPTSIKPRFVNHVSDIYVAFDKNNEKSSFYSKRLDEGLKILKSSGRYKKIFKENIR